MTSRERVLCALRHEETPDLPIDFGATRSSGIQVTAYFQLRDLLGLPRRLPRVFDVKQALADPDEDVLKRFRADARPLHKLSPSAGAKLDSWREMLWDDGLTVLVPANHMPIKRADGSYVIVDAQGQAVMLKPAGGLYFDDIFAPLAEADAAAIDQYDYPTISQDDLEFTRKQITKVPDGHAHVYSTGMSFFERGIKDFGYEMFMVRMMTEPELIKRYLDHLLGAYIQMLDRIAVAFGDQIDVLQFNDDLGNQMAPLISPGLYRALFFPMHKALYAHARRKLPHVHILLHSCGAIQQLLPDLIEAGVDAINPVQYNAAGMEPAGLKRDFGSELTFWGGACATQTVLTFGTVRDVSDEARRMIDIFAPGGGFVFNQVHNIQSGVAPEKVIALYDTAIHAKEGGSS